ncbi:hypothetical protein [uncultured Gimesia sp.]|uniref:hypothetical protein n=1 Tax=uncultured Gimesia sp. TaxID=1678688 RepID=UPI002623B0D9|nr:hypothetical protein [uncultured Gimesia sp.]
MHTEVVSKIEILDDELHLCLEGEGNASYQHIYREAQSVYWDPAKHSFKCLSTTGLSYPDICRHIISITKRVGVELSLSDQLEWGNVPELSKSQISKMLDKEVI